MNIYVLKACTGEYEDYSETILGYAKDMNKLEKVKAVLKEQYFDCEGYGSNKDKLYDLYVDYTGVWFKIELVKPIKEVI